MDERHSLSEPRLLKQSNPSSDGPKWEVDVLRENVIVVDTIPIDETTLPPRLNKKGRVAWRLPGDDSRLPTFGCDERRRILEMYKNRKKARKKKPSNAASVGNTVNTGNASDVKGGNGGAVGEITPVMNGKSIEKSRVDEAGKRNEPKKKSGKISISRTSSTGSTQSGLKGKKKNGRKNTFADEKTESLQKQSEKVPNELDDACTTLPNTIHEQKKKNVIQPKVVVSPDAQTSHQLHRPPPPGFSERVLQPTPTQLTKEVGEKKRINKSKTMLNTNQNVSNADPQSSIEPTNHVESLYISVIFADFQNENKTSISIIAARHFVSLYYPAVTQRLTHQLRMYYTPTAQKSVSVGGAHSVVTTPDEIAAQLASFAGSLFTIRGVVAQDGFCDGVRKGGVHILVTGLVQTGGVDPTTPLRVEAFSHSISLAQLPNSMLFNNSLSSNEASYFQIHNDAFALLSGDIYAAQALAVQQHQASKATTAANQGHPPPPGMQHPQHQPLSNVHHNQTSQAPPPGIIP